MSLREKILEDQKNAMKEHAEAKLATLRMLWSAIRNAEIDNGHKELTDGEIHKVVATQVKQLKDAMADFSKGGRQDLVVKAEAEVKVLSEYQPVQISDEELRVLISRIKKESGLEGPQAVGRLVGMVMKEVGARAEGNRVRELAAQLLS